MKKVDIFGFVPISLHHPEKVGWKVVAVSLAMFVYLPSKLIGLYCPPLLSPAPSCLLLLHQLNEKLSSANPDCFTADVNTMIWQL